MLKMRAFQLKNDEKSINLKKRIIKKEKIQMIRKTKQLV